MAAAESLPPGELPPDTGPPPPKGLGRVRAAIRRGASRAFLPLMQRAARPWVGGETVEDALSVAGRLGAEGFPCTLGLWDAPENTARQVADEYLAAVERLPASGLDGYVSIKTPAVRFDPKLAAELSAAAQARGVRLHFDSHGLEVADPSNALVELMLQRLPREQLGTTLPGRWARSLADADWAVERGLAVRVVKGQWPDPADPDRDMRAGFLEVIDRLAGRARRVAVASHDVPLAAESIARLRAAGTPCELELLFGLPMRASLEWARENGAGVRIYVPYGKGYLPHAVSQLRRNPRFIWWIVKDLLTVRRPR